ncbi:MAG: gamma-glutamyltransferase [Dehalococcoidia bacterium]
MADPARVELSGGFPHRGALRGRRGCVAADHPLAAQAGMAVLREGGSAADAAVAMGAVMVVVQPQYSQLGGDGFAMVWDQATRSVSAMNSAGPSPMGLDAEEYRRLGRIPMHGGLAVTAPGVVAGWWALHQRHGKLPWKRLFEDAIAYAREGFPASRGLARALASVGRASRESFPFEAGAGQPVVQAPLARTLVAIAAGGQEAFYGDEVASACRERLAADGAEFSAEEWQPPARWLEPIVGDYAGHRVWASPPQTQGFVLPLALALTPRPPLPTSRERGSHAVAMFNALHVALGLREWELSDPDVTGFDPQRYFAAEELERLLGIRTKSPVGARADGDTTYILAIDAAGNAVSWIQSVFAPWGSRVWVPEHGILMNNRMLGFTLEPGHPNEVAPGKRPAHTLHSYLATRAPSPPAPLPSGEGGFDSSEGAALAVVGGTPGGYRQPQNNMQILEHILREGMDVQDALDEPRWSVAPDGPGGQRRVEVEMRPGSTLAAEFESAGIGVIPFAAWDGQMGRPYVACREVDGSYAVGADLRGEGQALVW